ncbi:MAG: hypothetical protein ACKV2U_01800 [Bryobacteraceae bacterium]
MTFTIEVPDEQATALIAQAASQGLTLEAWFKKLAYEKIGTESDFAKKYPLQAAANIILEGMRDVPREIMAGMPQDGASQHDHYIHGWPKREA